MMCMMWWAVAALWAGAVLVAQQPPAAGQTAVAQGAIAGRVVDAESGAVVPGVTVGLSGAPGSATRPRQVLTDADGRFVFLTLPKGEYTLRTTIGGRGFSPSGFLVSGMGTQIGGYLDGGFGQRRPEGPLANLDLAEEERSTDAVIRLWRGAAIEGTVFDESGEPLVGQVVAAARRTSDGRLLSGPSTQTDDRGAYRLPTLTPGEYLVVVPQRQMFMPASLVEAATAAPLDAGTIARLTNTGATAPIGAGGMRTGASVLAPASAASVANSLPPVARNAGRVFVYQTTFYPNASAVSRATAVTLKSGEERTGVDLHLQPVPAVEVSGTLTDSRGPVANYAVRLFPAETGDDSAVLETATTVTDGAGLFTFPLVAAGGYTVVAMRTPPSVGAPPPADVTAGVWASRPVAVGDQPVRSIALTLREGVAVSGRLEFQGAAARPVPRAQPPVTFDRLPRLSRTNAVSYSAVATETGEFTIRNVAPGRYALRVVDVAPVWTLVAATAAGRDLLIAGLTIGDDDAQEIVLTYHGSAAVVDGNGPQSTRRS